VMLSFVNSGIVYALVCVVCVGARVAVVGNFELGAKTFAVRITNEMFGGAVIVVEAGAFVVVVLLIAAEPVVAVVLMGETDVIV
jgi:hypothetical protein